MRRKSFLTFAVVVASLAAIASFVPWKSTIVGPALNLVANKTPEGPIEDVPVWRLRVRIQVGDLDDAGTDGNVWVRLRPNGSPFYLDYGNNDFERGSNKMYDIGNLAKVGIATVRDIRLLTIGIDGTDALNLKSIKLYLNGSDRKPIFAYDFGTRRWLNNGKGNFRSISFSPSMLRRNHGWTLDGNPEITTVPTRLSKADVTSIVESYLGDLSKSRGLAWADFTGAHVTYSRKSAQVAAFKAYLAVEGHEKSLTADVFFDLRISCRDNTLTLTAANFKADFDFPLWAHILTLGVTKAFEEGFQKVIDAEIAKIRLAPVEIHLPVCLKVSFDQAGSVGLAL